MAVARQEEAPKPLLSPLLIERLRSESLRRGGIVLAWLAVLAGGAFAGFTITSRMIPDRREDFKRNSGR